MRVSIIGAGLAGSACAYFLSQRGVDSVIYDAAADIASGASGNVRGLYNPRFFAEYSPEASFYAQGFMDALPVFERFGAAIEYTPCGAVHLMNTPQKQTRFAKMVDSWPWGRDDMRLLSAAEASTIAGVEVPCDALYVPRSGMVSPRALCGAYIQASGAELRLGSALESHSLQNLLSDSKAVILACGMGAAAFEETADLPLRPVRGQVSLVNEAPALQALRSVVCYGGYVTPGFDGVHCVGSTFERGVDSNAVKDGDNADNLDKLAAAIPALSGRHCVHGARAAVRVTAPGHMPVIGHVCDNVYISAAHGSHGILSSLMGAQIVAAQITGAALPVSDTAMRALSPHRFSC